MADITTIEDAYFFLFFVVPGLLIIFSRSQFIRGGFKPSTENILSYFVVSSIYLAIFIPVISFLEIKIVENLISWSLFVFILPISIGTVLGVATRNMWIAMFLHAIHLRPVNSIPTSWDWKLGKIKACYVVVTLKDGTHFHGFFGEKSFVSSDPTERDLYIEKCYFLEKDGTWSEFPNSGVLISANETRTIEFFPATTETST